MNEYWRSRVASELSLINFEREWNKKLPKPYTTNGKSSFFTMHCRAPLGGDAVVKTGSFASVGNVRYQVWLDVLL